MSNIRGACTFRVALTCLSLPCFIAACIQPAGSRQQYGQRLLDTGRPALHAVHDDRLRQLMREMDDLADQRLPQEMNSGYAHRRRAEEWSETVRLLVADARAIPDVLREVRMSPDDRRLFEALASKLAEQAKELSDVADKQDFQMLQAKVNELTSTCVACHAAFRILPVISPSPR